MVTELRIKASNSQQQFIRALASAWRGPTQTFDPSQWLERDPDCEEKMLADPDIAHAVGYRRHLIAGRQWQVQAVDETDPRSDLAAQVATSILRRIERFTEARLLLARAFFSGARFALIHGAMMPMDIGDGRARMWWVPTHLEDRDKRMYRISPTQKVGDPIKAHWELFDLATDKWLPMSVQERARTVQHTYQDDQGTLGYGRALREALGWAWYAKQHVHQESLNAAERFGQGILMAKIDGLRDASTGLPNTELVAAWMDVLDRMRARNVLISDRNDDISFVPMAGEGWELLRTLREELRASIFTLVLGANLTTGADKGGSYALAQIQENSTEALVQYDRETLEESLTRDLIGSIWWHNYANLRELGIADQKPRLSINQDKLSDPATRATTAQTLHAMGVELSSDDVYEQTGFRKPKPGEDIIEKAAPPPAFPGFGGGFGGSPPDAGGSPEDGPDTVVGPGGALRKPGAGSGDAQKPGGAPEGLRKPGSAP